MDVDRVGEDCWPAIQFSVIARRSQRVVRLRWLMAASVVLLTGMGIFVVYHNSHKQNSGTQPVVLNTVSPERSPAKAAIRDNAQVKTSAISQVYTRSAGTMTRKKHLTVSYNGKKTTEQAIMNLEYTYQLAVNKQMENTTHLPILRQNASFRNDVQKRLHEIDMELKEIRMAIKRDGLDNNLEACLINVYQLKIRVLKLLQEENTKLEDHNSNL